jgi:hypothetical protein
MNIEHLKLFLLVAVTHNISVAGKELNLSPAVASSYISKLEEGLGVRLVHRTTRKVSLTEEGKISSHTQKKYWRVLKRRKLLLGQGKHIPRERSESQYLLRLAVCTSCPYLKSFCLAIPTSNWM